ncbi:EF-hand domain-containing protein [Stenotrophomonas sp. MMGLT7]|uniref:EF-hand domain-containing protein n=1 Tax=Stenotrophomonas sp. MMGLT7 TaxID=2901227 RepID=UPI001E2BEB35|nr:EF-hand domain-containing protein [Stenotrophomonas sp. MMGLT7]MCD7097745.1 EF-hand domain-containing protein [Stenotrophomonas sp. MMGLT7]
MNTRKNTSKLIALGAALAAAVALPAMAQSAQQDAAATNPAAAQPQSAASGGGQTWESVDTDGDGTISKQEAQVNAGLTQIFDQADSDKNGKLTTDEYKAFVASQQAGSTQP